MKHFWNISGGTFEPTMSHAEKHGQVITTTWNVSELIDEIVEDHAHRSPLARSIIHDYRVEDYTDEFRIYVRSGRRWRLLINCQYEGGEG